MREIEVSTCGTTCCCCCPPHPHCPPPPLLAASRLGKELGCPLRLSAFLRVQRGEGLETNKVDFATEVEQMVKAA